MSLRVVPARPQGAAFCPTCAQRGEYPWVWLVEGNCPVNQTRYRDGKIRPGGTCRLCWGHTSSPLYRLCIDCEITVRRQQLARSHGAYGYRAGCRCDTCRLAQRDRMRSIRARRRSAGTDGLERCA